MSKEKNRQALRSIEALQSALIALMEEKPYHRIKITEIAEKANLTRSTFYAHFETIDDLLNSIINNIIDEFFNDLYDRDVLNPDPVQDLEININFFRIWQKNRHLIPLLNSVDFDCLMVSRIKAFWDQHNKTVIHEKRPEVSNRFTRYISNFLAYSFVGFLKEWIHQDLQPSPVVMGELLYLLTGPPSLLEVEQKLSDRI
jgi:AcrR family transcriptional regulator